MADRLKMNGSAPRKVMDDVLMYVVVAVRLTDRLRRLVLMHLRLRLSSVRQCDSPSFEASSYETVAV